MKKTKKKLLITGISGLLGSNLAYCLKDRYEVSGWYYEHSVSMAAVRTFKVNLLSKADVKASICEIQPDVIIHCAAQANVEKCEENSKEAYKINVLGTRKLVECVTSSVKFVYISTDLVYDGKKGNCKETDKVGPLNIYGKTKVAAERIVSQVKNSLILRTNLFGWSLFERKSFAEWCIEELRQNKSIQGFSDSIFSSIYTFDLAKIIHNILKRNLRGIYNCGSRTALSKYEFLVEVAQWVGLDVSLIKAIPLEKSLLKAKRGKNLSLNVSKLEKNGGIKLPCIEGSIKCFVKDFNSGIDYKFKNFVSIKG